MAKRKKVFLPKPELNITAMMDLVLNLITFFALVANFSSQSLPKLDPPKPDGSKAAKSAATDRITINILTDTALGNGTASEIVFGITKIPMADSARITAMLEDMLARQKKTSDNVEIDLRADKNLRYDQVQPVMLAIVEAKIKKVNLVALTPD